jgi:hypothetical protein
LVRELVCRESGQHWSFSMHVQARARARPHSHPKGVLDQDERLSEAIMSGTAGRDGYVAVSTDSSGCKLSLLICGGALELGRASS